MKKALVLILSIIAFKNSFCNLEDFHTKDGRIFKNVKIVNEFDDRFEIQLNNISHEIYKNNIAFIDSTPFNPGKHGSIFRAESIENLDLQAFSKPEQKISLRFMLPVSLISFALSYEYFDNAAQLDKIKGDQSTISRQKVMGILFATIGLVNTVISFSDITISSNSDQIALSYKYKF